MEILLSRIPNIERYKIAIWLPVVYGLHLFNLLPELIFLIVLLGIYEIYARQPLSNWSIIALLHIIGLPTILLFPIKEIWFLLIIVSVNDTMAFFGGKYLNFSALMKRNIFPVVSPNKTLGGFFYGFLFGSITGIISVYFLELPVFYFLLTPSVCCVSIIGDLLNSKFKRHHQIKDSGENLLTGKLMFGHGGIYDRFDSISLVCIYWLGFKFLYI